MYVDVLQTSYPYLTYLIADLLPFLVDTDFVALGASNNAWNVVRSEFDALLLKHAGTCGAQVFTQTRVEAFEFAQTANTNSHAASSSCTRSDSVNGLSFEIEPLGRPVKATYTAENGAKGEISFDYLVDASGRAGLLSTKCVASFWDHMGSHRCSLTAYMRRYLKNRKYNQSLKNVAVWGYWRGTEMYGEGTDRQNAPFFEALSGKYSVFTVC